jgi:acyl-CoA thioester hydrolase
MPRLKLKPLENYPFRVGISVRVTDLNYGGHLGNDSLLSLVHEARVAFLSGHGLSEVDCGGVSLTMGDAAILYQGEAFAGDVLTIDVAAGEPTKSGFRLFYRVIRPGDGQKIALIETGMVCFDYKAKKIKPLPQAVKDICMII